MSTQRPVPPVQSLVPKTWTRGVTKTRYHCVVPSAISQQPHRAVSLQRAGTDPRKAWTASLRGGPLQKPVSQGKVKIKGPKTGSSSARRARPTASAPPQQSPAAPQQRFQQPAPAPAPGPVPQRPAPAPERPAPVGMPDSDFSDVRKHAILGMR